MEDLKKSVKELEEKIDNNAVKIIENMNKLHSHEEEIKNNSHKIEQNSYALDILKDYKNGSKRMFIALIVVLCMWFSTIGYLVYYINTTGYEIVTETAETTDSGNACVGDNCNNGEINYGKGN